MFYMFSQPENTSPTFPLLDLDRQLRQASTFRRSWSTVLPPVVFEAPIRLPSSDSGTAFGISEEPRSCQTAKLPSLNPSTQTFLSSMRWMRWTHGPLPLDASGLDMLRRASAMFSLFQHRLILELGYMPNFWSRISEDGSLHAVIV